MMNSDEWQQIDNCINKLIKNNKRRISSYNNVVEIKDNKVLNDFCGAMEKRKIVETYLEKLFLMEIIGIEEYIKETRVEK